MSRIEDMTDLLKEGTCDIVSKDINKVICQEEELNAKYKEQAKWEVR